MATLVASQTYKGYTFNDVGQDSDEHKRALRWTASESCTVEEFKAWLAFVGYPGPDGDIWIEIWDDDSGSPGSIITNGTSSTIYAQNLTNNTSGGAEETFTFSTPPSLTSGNDYYFVTGFDWTPNGSNYVRWYCSNDESSDTAFSHWNIEDDDTETDYGYEWALYGKIYKPSSVNVDASAGSVTVTGYGATVTNNTNVDVDAALGALTIAGYNINLNAATNIQVEAPGGGADHGTPGWEIGAYIYVGSGGDGASVTIAALNATVTADTNINVGAGLGALTITGHNPTVLNATIMAATVGTIGITGLEAQLNAGTGVNVAVSDVAITALNATIKTNISMQAAKGAVAIAGHDATISLAGNIVAGVGAVTIAGHNATVENLFETEIDVGLGAVTIAGHNATVVTAYNLFTNQIPLSIAGNEVTLTFTKAPIVVGDNAIIGVGIRGVDDTVSDKSVRIEEKL